MRERETAGHDVSECHENAFAFFVKSAVLLAKSQAKCQQNADRKSALTLPGAWPIFPPTLEHAPRRTQVEMHITVCGWARIGSTSRERMVSAGRRTSAWHGGQARAIGFAAAVNGTARKDVLPHRPIAPGTSGVRCPPRTPMFRGLFYAPLARRSVVGRPLSVKRITDPSKSHGPYPRKNTNVTPRKIGIRIATL
jgi:hypothetical protein